MSRYTPLSTIVAEIRIFLDELYGKKIQYEDVGFPLHMRAEGAELAMDGARDEIRRITCEKREAAKMAEWTALYADLQKSMRHTTRARERARSIASARRAQIWS